VDILWELSVPIGSIRRMADPRGTRRSVDASDENRKANENNRLGPIFDSTMRGVIEGDPMAACGLLGIEAATEPEILPSEFAAWSMRVDLLMRVGPGRLVHVEYGRR
jgi:hypothetical protein